jgi:hypothetical protein
MEIKLKNIRIYESIPIKFGNGTVGSHILIHRDDLSKIPGAMLAWDSTQPLSSLPVKWRNAQGEPKSQFCGHPVQLSVKDANTMSHACINALRIYRCSVINFPGGGFGTHILANTSDVTGILSSNPNLSDWDESKSVASLPAKWRGKFYRSLHDDIEDKVE